MPYFICPNCKERSIDLDGYDGFSLAGRPVPELRVRFLFELLEDYYPAPETGFVVCDRDARVLAAGRGVFELTGYRDADLIGREVVEALALSDSIADRGRARVGRPEDGAGARDPHERGHREARRRRLLPRLRRRRRPPARADAALDASARSRSACASASSSPSAAKSAVPAKSLRPSSPSGQAVTTHGSPASGTRCDARRHAAEHDLAATLRADRVRAGAVDRRPDDLGRDLARAPRRRVQRLAARDRRRRGSRARPSADAADEALAELRAPAADVRARARPPRPRPRPEPAASTSSGAGRASATSASPSRSRTPSPSRSTASGRSSGGGRRSVTSTVVRVDERREPAARVAAVRRRERAADSGAANVISIRVRVLIRLGL